MKLLKELFESRMLKEDNSAVLKQKITKLIDALNEQNGTAIAEVNVDEYGMTVVVQADFPELFMKLSDAKRMAKPEFESASRQKNGMDREMMEYFFEFPDAIDEKIAKKLNKEFQNKVDDMYK